MNNQNISCQTCQSPGCNGCPPNPQPQQFANAGQAQMQIAQSPQMQTTQQPGIPQPNQMGDPNQQPQSTESNITLPDESYVFVDMNAWEIIFWSIEPEAVTETVQQTVQAVQPVVQPVQPVQQTGV